MTFTQDERRHLADTLLAVGPDAPTLCGQWATRDLVVHLLLRETTVLAAGAIFLPPLRRFARTVEETLMEENYEDLVTRWRDLGPRVHPLYLLDRVANVAEFFVHHEDIRRAQEGWEPRALTREEEKVLADTAGRIGRFLVTGSVPVVLEPAGFPRVQIHGKRGIAAQGDQVVRVGGTAGEVLLWLYGRPNRCQVTGPNARIRLRTL